MSGIGNDPTLGICQTIRYGEYEVTYGHLSNVFAQFGQRVKAGQTVALSGDKLHIGIRFKGEELNPLEFLTMLYGNIQALCHADGDEAATSPGMAMALTTDYEQDRQEIEELMLRFLPHYMEDLQRGAYRLPPHTEQSLRHVFTMGAVKEYFYEICRVYPTHSDWDIKQCRLPVRCRTYSLRTSCITLPYGMACTYRRWAVM